MHNLSEIVENYAQLHDMSRRETLDFLARRKNPELVAQLLGVSPLESRCPFQVRRSIEEFFLKEGYPITREQRKSREKHTETRTEVIDIARTRRPQSSTAGSRTA